MICGLAYSIGFPIFDSDSGRYLAAAIEYRIASYAPTALPILLSPLVKAFGAWAFVAVNLALLSGTTILLSRTYFASTHVVPIILAILITASCITAMNVMMDFQTVTGALGLLVLVKRWSLFAWAALLIGLLSHNSAVLILFSLSIAMALLFRSPTIVVRALSALAVWFAITITTNAILTGKFRLSPEYAIHFATVRIMWDVPQSISSFAAHYPESKIAEYKEDLLLAAIPKGHRPFLWGENAVFRKAGTDNMAKEGKVFIAHSFRYFPFENLKYLILNPLELLFVHVRPTTMQSGLVRPTRFAEHYVSKFLPDDLERVKSGLQYRGQLGSMILPTPMVIAFYMSLMACAIMVVLSLLGFAKNHRDCCLVLPTGALVYVFSSVAVYGGFTALDSGRMHVKLLLVPILVSLLILSWMLARSLQSQSPAISEED